VLLMAILIAAAAVYFANSLEMSRLDYWLLVGLGALSLLMMFRISRPLWVLAPELHFVQFPWRYAVPLGVAFAFFLGASCGKFKKIEIVAVSLFVFAGPFAKIWLAVERPSSWNRANIEQFQRNFGSEIGYRGTAEYLPNGANGKMLPETWGHAEVGGGMKISSIGERTGDPRTVRVQSTSPQIVVLNVFDYPTWHVDVDGSPSSKLTDDAGCIVVSVPAGNHLVHISAGRTWDAKIGFAISLSTAGFLACSIFGFFIVSENSVAPLRHPDPEPKPYSSKPSSSTISVMKSIEEKQEHR
jgi:hypothetical protein